MPLRFFLTDDCPELETELRRAGHEVVGGPGERVTAVCAGTTWEPRFYNPVAWVQQLRPDVCLFVGPRRDIDFAVHPASGRPGVTQFGYHRDHVVKIKGVRNCITIGLARVGDDPGMTAMYRRADCPRCVAGPQSFGFWATADAGAAAEHARERRCALWRPGEGGADGIVALVESVRRREQYRGGKEGRVYGA